MKVCIVGAGLAGLTCARHLQAGGADVVVVEASDDVGGRVRSDVVEGFTLDRGFQVLFDAYPAVKRNLDLAALDLRAFDPGAIICKDGRQSVLTDPLRDKKWADVAGAAANLSIPVTDKLRTLQLSQSLSGIGSGFDPHEPDDQSTYDYLKAQGFHDVTIDVFFRPFYGGVLLKRDLSTTAAAFRFYFRMLSTGQTAVPSAGMGAVTQQLAAPLRETNSIQVNAPVQSLRKTDGRTAGVVLESGETIDADAVVLAVPAPVAARLAGLPTPEGELGKATIYFAGDKALSDSKKLVLNADPNAFVNDAQQISNVAPGYAPAGRHLLGATVLGDPAMDDTQLCNAAMDDLQKMYAGDREAIRALASYAPLRVYRIPYSQFPQPPGVYGTLPGVTTDQPGLYVAAEYTESSSIHGAMTSGENCAAAVLAG
ncbi:amine oxidase [Capsulimonas corticalis]|uniref:Amine oxidase n=1 Tax=Capsulimonas corticalis TaxID=2219043 RepID=A0A402D4F2_9BACT|nr:NAD(P)/FAD-dependent oxidoreductase [Capsulimonas corticalis]BDI29145.1 amine oxidase [Capsulimonas corticalis]